MKFGEFARLEVAEPNDFVAVLRHSLQQQLTPTLIPLRSEDPAEPEPGIDSPPGREPAG